MVYSKVCESTKLISIRRSWYDKQQKNHIVTGQIMSPEWNAKTVLVMDENYELWAMYEMHLQQTLAGVAMGTARGEVFIPDKCFPPFQAHGWARVQPQTQCTMAAAPERDSQRWNRREKGRLEFHVKTKAGIKETTSKHRLAAGQLVCWEAPGKVVSYFMNRPKSLLNDH